MVTRPRLTPAIADVRRAVREGLASAAATQNRPMQRGDVLLVACSGGPDSLALAAALIFEVGSAAFAGLDLKAVAVIVDHDLQSGSAEVAATTAQTLTKLGYPTVDIIKVTVGQVGGPEAAAREARYEALRVAAEKHGARIVLLGHTLSDQAETVLLGLARGSGARSLSGMAAVSNLADGKTFLRPLLNVSRETTVAFCADSGFQPWLDPQNKDPKFTRVRVRQTLLPMLETELGPGVEAALARSADLLRADADFLDDLASHEFNRLAKVRATELSFNLKPSDLAEEKMTITKLAPAIRGRVIKLALAVFSVENSFAHVTAIEDLLDNWHGQKPLTLPRVRVERAGDELVFKSTKTLKPGAC